MSQVRNRIKTGSPENEFEKVLERELLSYSQEVADTLNLGLKLEDNFNAHIETISDTGAANSENTVTHGLKRTPIGFLILENDKAGVIYKSKTATTTEYYIKCSVANCAVKIMIL